MNMKSMDMLSFEAISKASSTVLTVSAYTHSHDYTIEDEYAYNRKRC